MNLNKLFVLLGAGALMAIATEHNADASTVVAGYSGKAAWAADQGCFQDEWGAAVNNWCTSAAPIYVVSLPNVGGGSVIKASVYQPSAAKYIECNVNIMNPDHSVVGTSAHFTGSAGATTELTFNFGGTFIQPYHSIELVCTINGGARLNSVWRP